VSKLWAMCRERVHREGGGVSSDAHRMWLACSKEAADDDCLRCGNHGNACLHVLQVQRHMEPSVVFSFFSYQEKRNPYSDEEQKGNSHESMVPIAILIIMNEYTY
jgi:hypothetical protein